MGAAVYVYYRVAPSQRQIARELVNRVLDRMRTVHGVNGHLMESQDERLLWMEIYEAVADVEQFCTDLQATAEATGMVRTLAPGSRRHVERFVPLCA
ncbi:MAG: DUF4936 family protein [Burkholderiales bacterium]